MNKQSTWNKNWMNKQKEKGLCIFCNEPSVNGGVRCEKHIFVQLARTYNLKSWEILRDLFYEQNCKCYLTGRKLELNKNASVDHIIPRSKDPKLSASFDNILWCDKSVNLSKSGMSLEEFIEMCHEVVKEHPKNQQS